MYKIYACENFTRVYNLRVLDIFACEKFLREKISDEKNLHVKKISYEKNLRVKKFCMQKIFGKKFFRAKKLLFFTVISTKPRVMSSQSISGKCPKLSIRVTKLF